jgi:hypothetical protein
VGAEFFHAEGQTDITKLIVAFHNFAKAPKEAILFNPLTRRTAQLTSRRSILNIYSTNVRTEYFKHAA